MDPHHQYSSFNCTYERLVFQPGTSRIDARLVHLPDTSRGDSDDIWINPNSVLRGYIAHLAAQGVDLSPYGSGLRTPEMSLGAELHPRYTPNMVTVDSVGKGTGSPCKPGKTLAFSTKFKQVVGGLSRSLKIARFDRSYETLCLVERSLYKGHSNWYHLKAWMRFPIRLPFYSIS